MSSKEASRPINTGIVAARANFFASGPAKEPPLQPNKSSTLPVRPAPAIPLPNPAAEPQKKTAIPLTQTDITITKTITPAVKEATKSPESSPLPKKNRPLSVNVAGMKAMFNKNETPQPMEPALNSTLQKMASMFKQAPEANANSNSGDAPPSGGSSLPRLQSIKAAKINRESLRGIEISHPIPQSAIELPTQSKPLPLRPAPPPPLSQDTTDNNKAPELPVKPGISSTLPRLPKQGKVHFAIQEEDKEEQQQEKPVASVEKSESMRIKGVTPRPNIQQFGSMRGKRPVSMPFVRPTSPPPNPPSSLGKAIVENEYSYDDCSMVRGETDAIYASIDDLPDVKLKRDDTGSTTTSNSDGLLSEIVSELKKKNPDTIASLKGESKPLLSGSSSSEKTKSNVSTSASAKPGEPPPKADLPTKPSLTATTSESSSQNKPALSNQPYKPYSSSLAARNRYLGNSGGTGAAGTSETTSQKTEASDVTSQTSAKGESASSSNSSANPKPLPEKPPVGKSAPVNKNPADLYSSVNKTDSKKTAGTTGSAPGVKSKTTPSSAGASSVTSKNASVKGKAATPTANANNKPSTAAARPSVASNAAANKPAARATAASPSSNSSLAKPNAAPSGNKNPLVQSMQKKFDASGSKAGPAPAVKTKTNAKQ